MKNSNLLTKIAEIRTALKKQLFNCALTMTLTLPDICGKVEYPQDNSGDRFTKWFDVYAIPYFTVEAKVLPGENKINYTWLSSKECWKIRNAVLHAGNYKLEGIDLSLLSFHAHKKCSKIKNHICRQS